MNPMVAFQIVKGVAAFGQAQANYNRTEADYFRNRQAAVQARDISVQGLNRRAIQEAEAAGQSKVDLAIRALEVQGAKAAAQAETGLTGASFQKSRDLTKARELRGKTTINQQLTNTINQIELEKAGVNSQALNRINSMPRGEKPNIAAFALSTASSVVSADLEYGGGEMFGKFFPNYGTTLGLSQNGLIGDNTVSMPEVPTYSLKLTGMQNL